MKWSQRTRLCFDDAGWSIFTLKAHQMIPHTLRRWNVKAPFSWQIGVKDSSRRNKAAFSNFSRVVWMGPERNCRRFRKQSLFTRSFLLLAGTRLNGKGHGLFWVRTQVKRDWGPNLVPVVRGYHAMASVTPQILPVSYLAALKHVFWIIINESI